MSVGRWRVRTLVALGLSLLAGPARPADPAIRARRVRFRQGAGSAIVTGRIRGYETVDHLLSARAGQQANISLATHHGATSFNLLAPGQTEVAFFNGSVSLNQYEGRLPADGDYRIRVYMLRSAARRHEVAHYRLEIVLAAADGSADQAGPAAARGKLR